MIRKQERTISSKIVWGTISGFLGLACGAAAPVESSSPTLPLEAPAIPATSSSASAAETAPIAKESPSDEATESGTEAPSEPAPAPAAVPPRCPEGMQLVPGGTFTTATNRRAVVVADLCVDTFETTAALYKQCVDAGKCTTNKVLCSEQSTWGQESKQNHPMVCVDFSQAEAYCSYREKRLPETGEWEWVARGGEAARKYPWGNEEPDQQLCWQGKKALSGTCAVGSFPEGKSAHGIYDLSGNVHEFTTTAQDEQGPVRIARGGSWKEGDPHMMWPGRIGGFETSYRCGFLGIRCVNEASPEQSGNE